MRIKLAFNPIKFLGVAGRIALHRDVGPFGGIFGVDLQPFIKAWFSIGLYRVSRAFRLTNATVNAFVGVDYQHVFAFVEAVYGADFHAIHIFTFDAIFSDDVGHFGPQFWLLPRQIAE